MYRSPTSTIIHSRRVSLAKRIAHLIPNHFDVCLYFTMSTPPGLSDRGQVWYFGIPWTIMQMESALAQVEPTTDPYELELRQAAKAERTQAGAADLYEWGSETVGVIINKSPVAFVTALCIEPSKTYGYRVDVLVLRKKRGDSESDLEESPDLLD